MSSVRHLTDAVPCLAECLVGHTGQVLAPAWPEAGGGRWVKALYERAPRPRPLGSDVALRGSLCC